MATQKKDPAKEKRKRTAVISAVLACLQAEQAAMRAAPAATGGEPAAKPAPPPSLWGASGRQDARYLRNMMQLKAFHGARRR